MKNFFDRSDPQKGDSNGAFAVVNSSPMINPPTGESR
jgi:hypothetical protein